MTADLCTVLARLTSGAGNERVWSEFREQIQCTDWRKTSQKLTRSADGINGDIPDGTIRISSSPLIGNQTAPEIGYLVVETTDTSAEIVVADANSTSTADIIWLLNGAGALVIPRVFQSIEKASGSPATFVNVFNIATSVDTDVTVTVLWVAS